MLKAMDDRSLTDSWVFDEGSEVQGFDAETLLNTIMLKGMSFEPLFTDPKFYYVMNNQWWNKWKNVFDKWFVVLEKEYEPLWDRNGFETVHEDTTDTGTLDTATSGRRTVDNDTTGTKSATEVVDDDTSFDTESHTTEQASGKDKTTHDSDRDVDVTNSVSAFDSNQYQPHDHSHTDDTLNSENTETTYGKKVQTDGTENGTGTDDKTTTYNESTTGTDDTTEVTSGTVDTDTTGDRDFDRDYHSWGNWGISQTSQKLLMSELQTRYWNIYEHIADIFLDEMTVGVF